MEGTLRALLQGILVGVLSASLVGAPVAASTSPRTLGVVLFGERARVGAGEAVVGTTVFAGDTLTTDAAGTLRVRTEKAQFILLEDSVAELRETPGGVGTVLKRGSIVISAEQREALEVLASAAFVRPEKSQPTYGQVTLINRCEIKVTSERGSLEVSLSDRKHIVPEGNTHRVWVRPVVPDADCPAMSPWPSGYLWVPLAAIGAGAGIAVVRPPVSPHKP